MIDTWVYVLSDCYPKQRFVFMNLYETLYETLICCIEMIGLDLK